MKSPMHKLHVPYYDIYNRLNYYKPFPPAQVGMKSVPGSSHVTPYVKLGKGAADTVIPWPVTLTVVWSVDFTISAKRIEQIR